MAPEAAVGQVGRLMARRSSFWLVFAALAIGGVAAAVTLFSTALPSISVDIDMNREAAMDSAAALAERYGWGADDDRSAATFGLADGLVQTYVELEGGGREVVERLAERNVYEAYQWRVRRFAEGRIEESWARFTPSGEPYGFRLLLSEDDPGGGSLTSEDAHALAETTAVDWGVDLGFYELVESSSQTLPGGREDHTLVFERTDEQLAEARFRLRVVVSGQRASELTHFVSVPEAFTRRYADMRSTNDAIALVAQAILFVVFGLLGAGVGSALLLRRRWIEWRTPLLWGGVIAVLFGAATVNQLPLSWTEYDTALSATSFALQVIAGGAAIALLGTPLIAFFLLAGESLGRRAFPGHVQQWRFWSPDVGSSNTALGMTVAAYLLVGIQVGYVVLFYLGTQRLEGWWSPADALVQPDLLATYLPWLEAVSLALFASFWEESLFRAVPIACAALLGARFGKRGLWIWGAVVVQAVVFAAAHANYPQQPPYARVLELTAPALLWGTVYVFYGLVPTILAHFLYDLSLVSIVLFESEALLDQAVIVTVGLVPLAVVVGTRLRHGARAWPPESAYNRGWSPSRAGEAESKRPSGVGAVSEQREEPDRHEVDEDATVRRPVPAWLVWTGAGLGAASIVTTALTSDPPAPLWGDRSGAVEVATSELEGRGVELGRWEVFVTTSSGATEGRDYVFTDAGDEAFSELEGVYFGVPRWLVRLVDWDAEPAERVEEHRVWVGPDGEVDRVRHTLPEARPGASLSAEEARRLALEAVTDRFGVTESEVREVEAEETSRPNRTDWLFSFTEIGRLGGVEGEARIQVRVSGDEVTDAVRTIYVPEEWQRERRRVESRNQIMRGGLLLLLLVGFGTAAVTAVVVWSRGGLPTPVLWKLTAATFLALVASSANDWPATTATFATGQPWGFQVGATLVGLALLACLAAPVVGLVGALAHGWLNGAGGPKVPGRAAVALGLGFGGLWVLGTALVPGPQTASYFGAATAVPLLAPALAAVPPFLLLTSGVLLVVAVRERFLGHPFVASTIWSLVVAVGVVAVPQALQRSLFTWGLSALLVVVVLAAALQTCRSWPVVVPGIVAMVLAVRTVEATWSGPYAGAELGGLIAVPVLGTLAWAWTVSLGTRRAPRSAASTDEP